LHEKKNNALIDDLINILINLRTKAKNEKNYKLADEIRNELKIRGILLEDKKESTTYKIIKYENI
jgi:cysteinyl-tRNA synthetase